VNIRKIVNYNNLRKQLAPEELAFADVLLNATDSERELLITALQPAKSAGKKKAAAKKAGSKSPRASSMAATLGKNLAQQRKPMCAACGNDEDYEDHGTGEGQHEFDTNVGARLSRLMNGDKCAYEVDGKVCHGAKDSAIHDPSMGYAGYHEFVGAQVAAVGGEG
jgi:hypothetical protein